MNPAIENTEAIHDSNPRSSRLNATTLTLLVVALSLTAGVVVFESAFQGKVLPGVIAAGVPVGGLSPAAARAKLEAALMSRPAPELKIKAGNQSQVWSAKQLGWQVNVPATAQLALEVGRRGPIWKRIQERLNALGAKLEIPLQATVNETTVRADLTKLAQPFLVAPKDASLQFSNGHFVVKPDQAGRGLNLEPSIAAYVRNPNLTLLELKVVPLIATHQQAEFAALAKQANGLLRPLKLTYITPGEMQRGTTITRTLGKSEVAKLLQVQNAKLTANPETVLDRLERLANAFDQPARQARYMRFQGQLVVKPEARGWKLDLKTAQSLLSEELLRPDSNEVILPVIAKEPRIATQSLPKLDALSLISEATTTYYGSSRERMTNVATATGKLDGYVVPAGENFDFNEAVGPIELENGFAEALVISAGRTVKGVGGGVCQASTTAFRALYKAGLPVIERNQHAYRVHWYDPIVGLDAAVYQPTLNLVMHNDTPGPLLIRTETSPGRTTVRVYGLPNTRQVYVSNPVILSRTPHPPPAYEFDPTLPAGTRKQVDWAEDGYRVRVTRTITDEAGSRTDVTASDYRAWRAVYAIGPSVRKSGPLASRTSSR